MLNIPPASREVVMEAFLSTLSTLSPATFVTVERKLRLWDDVPPEQQPALFITEHTEHQLNNPRGLPSKRELNVMLFVYAKVPDDGVSIGATILNNLADAIEGVLKPDTSEPVQTLGGIVYRVWSDGLVRKDPGDLDGQALLLYPLKIRMP
jgi:hypothetical protein